MIFDFITFFHIFLPFRSDISIFPGQRTVHGVPYRRLGRFLKYRLVITGTLWKQNGPRESGSVVIGDLQFCYQKVSRRHGSRWLLECVFYLLSVVVFLRFRLMVKRFFFWKGRIARFFDATTHLQKRPCPSVRQSVPCYFRTTKIAVFEGGKTSNDQQHHQQQQ